MPYPLVTEKVQVLNEMGEVVGDIPDLSPDRHLEIYYWMVFGRVFSNRMIALQRQGRMGTFAPHNGQEASAAIATPLVDGDWLMGSYRENIPYFMRGVKPVTIMAQSRGLVTEGYKHEYGVLPMQIVLATQMPHAAGIAMAMKYEGKPNVAVGVCGDGATSEGDFNEALNFAGAFKAPLVSVIQNNGWAISTPRHYQTATEFLAHRGPAFGMPGILVDGNDVLAVHKVMSDAVARARAGDGPSLIEMLTYRMGAHTTADDPTKYRPAEELAEWEKRDPIQRYRVYLRSQDILADAADEEMHEQAQAEMQAAVDELEALYPLDPNVVFDYTFETLPPTIEKQRREILGEAEEVAYA